MPSMLQTTGLLLIGILLCSHSLAEGEQTYTEVSNSHQKCQSAITQSRHEPAVIGQKCRTISASNDFQIEEESSINDQGEIEYLCNKLDYNKEEPRIRMNKTFCREVVRQGGASTSYMFAENHGRAIVLSNNVENDDPSYIALQLIYLAANLLEIKVHLGELNGLYKDKIITKHLFHTAWLLYEFGKHITHAANIGFWIPPFSASSAVELGSTGYELWHTTTKITASIPFASLDAKAMIQALSGNFDNTTDFLGYISMWLNSAITIWRSVVHDIIFVRVLRNSYDLIVSFFSATTEELPSLGLEQSSSDVTAALYSQSTNSQQAEPKHNQETPFSLTDFLPAGETSHK
ncbi:hypothetical protein EOPP23_04955 [Endozoicomonas sp. OPT23]|uniref:hypothetical protein n=1 Tax=Endozoicomonas sp. OPT23 TaxID=2072845 RepID=UPI00129BE93C|nr:hypothetical protein [Endozoicomonas sp. OPT23]MRI32330.1 hypothetical protein [Endozoicomonas sp. OPT23]